MPDKFTIKEMRRLRGLTLEKVAANPLVAISREHLGKIENDFGLLRSAKIGTVLDLLNLYGFNIDQVKFF